MEEDWGEENGSRPNEMLRVLQLCYRKHVLDDDSIGWNELSLELADVLSEVMSDDEFEEWIYPFNLTNESNGE